ncbi:MAG: hypothetical protein SF162_08665 [bacterium]|nr:hypothetical protein [bacterium]
MQTRLRFTTLDVGMIALVTAVVAVISTAQIYQVLNVGSDYSAHLQFWQVTLETGRLIVPHVLFPVSAYAVSSLMNLPPVSGGLVIGVLAHVLAGLIVYGILRGLMPARPGALWLCAALSIALSIAYPVTFFTYPTVYHGYITPTVWHNPTLAVLKPFTLPLFLVASRSVLLPHTAYVYTASGFQIGFTAALSVVALFAKPSFTLVLLPALIVAAMYQRVRGERVEWRWFILGFVLPSVIGLAVQYALTFGGAESGSSIAFAPFAYINRFLGDNPAAVVIALIGSLAYPGVVYIAYRAAARGDALLNVAWIALVFALVQYYFLAETGSRANDGNWVWGAHAAMFVLYTVSTAFVLRQVTARDGKLYLRARDWIVVAAFMLTVISGVLRIGAPVV